jgi:hypothetical protein
VIEGERVRVCLSLCKKREKRKMADGAGSAAGGKGSASRGGTGGDKVGEGAPSKYANTFGAE